MKRHPWGTVAGMALAGAGGWAGYWLGGDVTTAGAGIAIGAVTGAFAPSFGGWLTGRARARDHAASTSELPTDVAPPSRLLHPRRHIVPFTGRDSEIADLVAWCESPSAPRLRLITGPGGTGKTRLALQFADTAKTLGWRCQWVGDGQEATVVPTIRAATTRRLLLIVDYAETRIGLKDLLRAVATDHGDALRVLLLARSTGPWWEQLSASEPAIYDLITAAGPEGHLLSLPVDPTLTDHDLINQAIPHFARELGTQPPLKVQLTPSPRRARVLELHAAALVAVLRAASSPPATPVPVNLTAVLDELLRHEERFWLGSAHAQQLLNGPYGLTPATIRHIIAATCLLGATEDSDAFDLLHRIPGAPATIKTVTWLRALYPPDPDSGEWLGTLQPDRLAEHHTITQLATTPALAGQCLTNLDDRQARRAVTLLARASTEHDTAAPLLERLLPLISPTLTNLRAPTQTLQAIATAIPYPTIVLASAYATITQRILDTLPLTPNAERAYWLTMRGIAQAQLGHVSDALPITAQAVTIYRELAVADPDRYRLGLAQSLTNLGVWLSALGRPDDALAVTEEAININRELAATNPDGHHPDLATALDNLGVWLSALGRPDDALPPAEEAVTIRRELAATTPDRYQPGLADALANLGVWLSALGRPDDALPPAEEAVTIYRELAATSPDRHRPNLAAALIGLGAGWSALGRLADALAVTEEAVTIRRELAATSPDRYQPDLATALDNLGVRLSALGRPADALAVTEEAVTIYRELAATSPGRHQPNLAQSLTNLSIVLWNLGRPADALPPAEEAITIYRELAATNPDRHRPGLAQSLSSLGAGFSALGRPTDALAVTEEAVTIRRELAATNPDRHRPGLAQSLSSLGIRYSALGRPDDALPPAEEAVTIYRELAATDPHRNRPGLAQSLTNLGIWLSALGRPDDALPPAEEAVTIYRELAATNPGRHQPDLAQSLTNLGHKYSALGRPNDTLLSIDEAVTIYRKLAATDPGGRHGPSLAAALIGLGAGLWALGRPADALPPAKEAVAIYRELAAADPGRHRPNLARALKILEKILRDLRRHK